MRGDALARLLVHTWALDAAAFARVLAEQDPSWRSEARELAGGWLVLSGAGLYVNRAIGAGVRTALTGREVDVVIARSDAVGVPAAFEVTPWTHPATLDRLSASGFEHDAAHDVQMFVRGTGLPRVERPHGVVTRAVESFDDLARWMEVSALGWGHVAPAARRASDAFSRAAHAIDGDGMVIAHDAGDGRPLGCASLTVRDRIATLGGMSTIPDERGRGVQAALIAHRLAVASARGCTVAASTAKLDGASARNLVRHGFVPRAVITTWTRRPIVRAHSVRSHVLRYGP
jgi:GNAT superfamily N-acetyltransferase